MRSIIIKKFAPSTWTPIEPDVKAQLVSLSSYCTEYMTLERQLKYDLPSIKKIQRVENPYLWGCYLLKKRECQSRGQLGAVKEMKLYHATSQKFVLSIVSTNLDWRRSFRNRFGQGVSFSPDASYANKYCNPHIGSDRALVVALVLVGKSHDGWYDTEMTREGYDTSTGNCDKVYVKYYDHEFYPQYIVYY
ncbi:hypothetical protein L9F63_012720 [Diploptera punctata]|uniref:Poly [ADP-ribose] polymerase n=1 Tax=Diploptera punctata TaxID=6984 RepID=A0AAD8ABN0_DIPPU|nr:hypothetical protein L9F63_012720 [Diploptera punctata]